MNFRKGCADIAVYHLTIRSLRFVLHKFSQSLAHADFYLRDSKPIARQMPNGVLKVKL